MQQKRVRSANFTPEEKLLCLNLIESYKSIVECKKTDAKTCREKEEVWKKIEFEFNFRSTAGIKRTKESLKKFYENKKKGTRKVAAENTVKMDSNPLDKIVNEPTLDLTMSVLNEKVIIGLKNEFDDDEDCVTLEEEFMLPYDTDNNENYENKADERENLVTRFNDKVTAVQEEMDSHFLGPRNSPQECSTVEVPLKKKACIECNWISRRRPTTTTLAKKYEDLTAIKIKCSTTQLDILKIEKEIALQKLKTGEEENDRRKEEDERKREDHERKRREIEIQKEREEKLFNLKCQSLLLDIEIKKCQLQKLNSEKL